MRSKTYHRKKLTVLLCCVTILLTGLFGRLVYLMIGRAKYYQQRAVNLHEREREIKAARGNIIDRNGVPLTENKTVCTVSVIQSQLKETEKVIQSLARELSLSEEEVRKKVMKHSLREQIQSNVEKEVGDRIRGWNFSGVKVDEDFKRYYPYGKLASRVIGFTGRDNQGIIGLEVAYEKDLKGKNGKILTVTDARGIELCGQAERRFEPVAGNTLRISMDSKIQNYAWQGAKKVRQEKQAREVYIIVMNPQNGEILAMVNEPEFDLNDPYTLLKEKRAAGKTQAEALNQMWRNGCINDTYEPGSAFKIMTTAACLEAKVLSLQDTFQCPGYKIVEDRRIRCWKTAGHGSESFAQGLQNSCNPVFMTIGLRLGASRFYDYFQQFGLLGKTGIDLPGEAGIILHKKKEIGEVELATMSFGQSFQITPIQMAATVSAMINGGKRVTPHFGVEILNGRGECLQKKAYAVQGGIVSAQTSATMCELLESVVAEGGGKKASIEGYRIGGKTATSQTLPRNAGQYISSFVGFAPADDPKILAMAVIHNPQGIYYGGIIAAPVIRELFENILPYLGLKKTG